MIPASIVELLHSGVSVVVGTRDAALLPDCTRAWGIRVEKGHASVTIFLTDTVSRKTLENVNQNGLIAISCTRPTDHVACQLKGHVRSVRPADERDRNRIMDWHREFTGEAIAIGVPAQLCEAWITEPALAILVDVTDVFLQTPGPGTGEKI